MLQAFRVFRLAITGSVTGSGKNSLCCQRPKLRVSPPLPHPLRTHNPSSHILWAAVETYCYTCYIFYSQVFQLLCALTKRYFRLEYLLLSYLFPALFGSWSEVFPLSQCCCSDHTSLTCVLLTFSCRFVSSNMMTDFFVLSLFEDCRPQTQSLCSVKRLFLLSSDVIVNEMFSQTKQYRSLKLWF